MKTHRRHHNRCELCGEKTREKHFCTAVMRQRKTGNDGLSAKIIAAAKTLLS